MKGLYVITPDNFDSNVLGDYTQSPGWCALQYRDKGASPELARKRSSELLRHTRRWGIPLIINDHGWLCSEIGAEGLHVGEFDGGLGQHRLLNASDVIIGSSCYNSLERAHQALAEKVSYISFGAFFPTPTKPDAPKADISLIKKIRNDSDFSSVSIFAIGGIEPTHCASLVNAGADGVCVVRGVLAANNIAEASASYISALPHHLS